MKNQAFSALKLRIKLIKKKSTSKKKHKNKRWNLLHPKCLKCQEITLWTWAKTQKLWKEWRTSTQNRCNRQVKCSKTWTLPWWQIYSSKILAWTCLLIKLKLWRRWRLLRWWKISRILTLLKYSFNLDETSWTIKWKLIKWLIEFTRGRVKRIWPQCCNGEPWYDFGGFGHD
jgi:hypothetical protein